MTGQSAVAVGEPPCVVPQVESEKQPEHEAQRLREHLAMLLAALLEAGALRPGPRPCQAAELLPRCEALQRKTATFENIVCVLNREVERVAMTAEACGRQHRLDQDRIEALSNKVRARDRSRSEGSGGRAPVSGTRLLSASASAQSPLLSPVHRGALLGAEAAVQCAPHPLCGGHTRVLAPSPQAGRGPVGTEPT